MYCKNCGNYIDDNAVVCIHCGTPTGVQPVNVQPSTSNNGQSNTIAIVGFVLAFFVPLAGLICSIIGLKRTGQFGGNGKGLAIAGIVISAVAMLIEVIVTGVYGAALIALFASGGGFAA